MCSASHYSSKRYALLLLPFVAASVQTPYAMAAYEDPLSVSKDKYIKTAFAAFASWYSFDLLKKYVKQANDQSAMQSIENLTNDIKSERSLSMQIALKQLDEQLGRQLPEDDVSLKADYARLEKEFARGSLRSSSIDNKARLDAEIANLEKQVANEISGKTNMNKSIELLEKRTNLILRTIKKTLNTLHSSTPIPKESDLLMNGSKLAALTFLFAAKERTSALALTKLRAVEALEYIPFSVEAAEAIYGRFKEMLPNLLGTGIRMPDKADLIEESHRQCHLDESNGIECEYLNIEPYLFALEYITQRMKPNAVPRVGSSKRNALTDKQTVTKHSEVALRSVPSFSHKTIRARRTRGV